MPRAKMKKAKLAVLGTVEADLEIQQADREILAEKYETYEDVESFVDELNKRAKRNVADQPS